MKGTLTRILGVAIIALIIAAAGMNQTQVQASVIEAQDTGQRTLAPQENKSTETPEATFQAGEMRLHTSRDTLEAGKSTILTVAITNPKDNPMVTATVSVKIPDGARVATTQGTGWGTGSCTVECTAEIQMQAGTSSEENAIEMTAETDGVYVVTATAAWTTEGNSEVIKTTAEQALTVTARDKSAATSPVALHATTTTGVEGEPIDVTLSMLNSIINETMTAMAIIEVPPGMSVSSSVISGACIARCNIQEILEPGANKGIILNVTANEPGEFVLKGKMEWFYGDKGGDRGKGEQEIILTIAERPTPMPDTSQPQYAQPAQPAAQPTSSNGGGWNLSSIIAGIVIFGIGGLFLYKKIIKPLLND